MRRGLYEGGAYTREGAYTRGGLYEGGAHTREGA